MRTSGPGHRGCLDIRVDDLPLDGLSLYDHFVTWLLEWRAGKDGKPGRWTKPPIDPMRGGYAESTNPSTWGPWHSVIGVHERAGFVVAQDDPFSFLDCDNAVDAETETIKPWARSMVQRFPTYWEYSPSGTGLKGWLRATAPQNRIIPLGDGKVEIFSHGKFSTLTGHRIAGTSPTITDCQSQLDAFYAQRCAAAVTSCDSASPPRGSELRDEEVLARARAARNGPKFERLFDGGDTADYDDNTAEPIKR